MTILRVGDWPVAMRILQSAGARVRIALDRAVQQEAQFLRAKIVEGLRDQTPGGQALLPLAESTIAKRNLRGFRGTKALLVRGDLRNGFVVQRSGWGAAFVGVLRTARSREGSSLANVAELNEFGSRPIVIRITPKMRAFLAALSRAQGGAEGGGHGGGGVGVIVVQIPARPFIRPVVEMYFGNRDVVAARFLARVGGMLNGDFGGPGGGGRGGGGSSGGGGGGGSSRRGGGGPAMRDPSTGRFVARR